MPVGLTLPMHVSLYAKITNLRIMLVTIHMPPIHSQLTIVHTNPIILGDWELESLFKLHLASYKK